MSNLSSQTFDEEFAVYRVWWSLPGLHREGKFTEVNARSYLHAVAVSALSHLKDTPALGPPALGLTGKVPYLVEKRELNWVRVAVMV